MAKREPTWELEYLQHDVEMKFEDRYSTLTGAKIKGATVREVVNRKDLFFRKVDAERKLATLPEGIDYRLWQRILQGYEYRWTIRATNDEAQRSFAVKYPVAGVTK